MRLFRFDSEVGRPLTAFGSADVRLAPVARVGASGDDRVQIGCMHIAPGGHIGAHPAVGPQLFLVVAGEGWVRGAAGGSLGPRRRIVAGQAVFWEPGEQHESGSERGMMAVVVEGANLDPARYMPEDGADSTSAGGATSSGATRTGEALDGSRRPRRVDRRRA